MSSQNSTIPGALPLLLIEPLERRVVQRSSPPPGIPKLPGPTTPKACLKPPDFLSLFGHFVGQTTDASLDEGSLQVGAYGSGPRV